MQIKARVINKIQGYYYVDIGNEIRECRLRGTLKRENNKFNCVVGDFVDISIDNQIINIYNRKNLLIRPIVSNIDFFAIQLATKNPLIDFNRLHILILHSFYYKVKPLIVINKLDLTNKEELDEIISKLDFLKEIGVDYFLISSVKKLGIEKLENYIKDKTTAIGGPSGVGKSSLINLLQSEKDLKTGETSKRLKRGKHTTRDSKLLKLNIGGYIIDTPGFSSIDIPDIKSREELFELFPEFKNRKACKFLNCSHNHEPSCGIKEAVSDKQINIERYNFYLKVYQTLKERGSI